MISQTAASLLPRGAHMASPNRLITHHRHMAIAPDNDTRLLQLPDAPTWQIHKVVLVSATTSSKSTV